jgi:hypothetical protein
MLRKHCIFITIQPSWVKAGSYSWWVFTEESNICDQSMSLFLDGNGTLLSVFLSDLQILDLVKTFIWDKHSN